ncbi:MAG: integrase [Candidatus Bathyarchaeia archaeon]
MKRQNSFESFLRILNASSSDILDWYNKAILTVRDNERLYLEFAKISGIRKEEAINAFNLIIKLSKENRLSEYYDKELNCLMHFKYPKLFLRNTKNVYISFIPESLINKIAASEPVTYSMIRKRLSRSKLKIRINELRDYFATYMRKHNIQKEEIDMLQGRIPTDIFIRHYWSPQLEELRDRVLRALHLLEKFP